MFFNTVLSVSLTKSVQLSSSQNDMYEESHDGSADQPGDRNRDEPGDEDVPEQTPVH